MTAQIGVNNLQIAMPSPPQCNHPVTVFPNLPCPQRSLTIFSRAGTGGEALCAAFPDERVSLDQSMLMRPKSCAHVNYELSQLCQRTRTRLASSRPQVDRKSNGVRGAELHSRIADPLYDARAKESLRICPRATWPSWRFQSSESGMRLARVP